MAKKFTVTLVKASHSKMAKAASGVKAAGDSFILSDDGQGNYTVYGVDKAGAQVDISTVATLNVSSNDTTVLTVDPPVGATFTAHGVKPNNPGNPVKVMITATWLDGSIGPFSIEVPFDVTVSPVTGLIVVEASTPIPRP